MYEPKNYSLDYAGEVSIAEALSQSINIPAVKLLNEIGINSFMKFLKNN
jgi:membrane carboxypeptidase/penicillin-binding protein PbpC